MSKCLVGFCHLMGIFTLLASAAHIVGGIDDLTSQLFLHGAAHRGLLHKLSASADPGSDVSQDVLPWEPGR